MRVDVLTTFPGMFASVMNESMMKRAQEAGILDFKAHDLRNYTHDRHKTTDDSPYGGGPGLVMMCAPIFEAYDALCDGSDDAQGIPGHPYVVIPAPHGRTFDDELALELSTKGHLLFICGHYEGMDERVYSLADEVISIGDYILTSGELSSMVIIDAAVRKLPGVLGAEGGAEEESFANGLLEHPQYTRPSSFKGMKVPEVLLSGDHAKVDEWRRQRSLERTAMLRPDLIARADQNGLLGDADREFLKSL